MLLRIHGLVPLRQIRVLLLPLWLCLSEFDLANRTHDRYIRDRERITIANEILSFPTLHQLVESFHPAFELAHLPINPLLALLRLVSCDLEEPQHERVQNAFAEYEDLSCLHVEIYVSGDEPWPLVGVLLHDVLLDMCAIVHGLEVGVFGIEQNGQLL